MVEVMDYRIEVDFENGFVVTRLELLGKGCDTLFLKCCDDSFNTFH